MNLGGFTHAKHLGTQFTSNGKHGFDTVFDDLGRTPNSVFALNDINNINAIYFLRAGEIIITIWRPSSFGMDST